MCNNTFPPKYKVSVLIFFQQFIFFSFINLNFSKGFSSIKYGLFSIGYNLLIAHVSVGIIPLIMHFTTAVRFFLSCDDLKFSIMPDVKFAVFLVGS